MASKEDPAQDGPPGYTPEQEPGHEPGKASRRPAHTIDVKAVEEKSPEQDAGGPTDEARSARADPKDAERRAARTPPPRTPMSEVRGFFTHLAAGLLGGLIGVIGAGVGLEKLPLDRLLGRGDQTASAIGAIDSRLDALEDRIASVGKTAQDSKALAPQALAPLAQRISQVEQKLGQQKDVPQAMEQRLERLETSIKALGEAAQKNGNVAEAAAVTGQINDLASKVDGRIAAVEDKLAKGGDPAAIALLRQEVNALKSEIAKRAATPAASALPADLGNRLAALEKTLKDIAARPAPAPASHKEAALAVALAGLRISVESGQPYANELAAVKQLAPPELDLSGLAAHAGQGVAPLTVLQELFPRHAAAARAAAARPKEDGSVLGRLVGNARSLVKVRRLDGQPGGDVVARMAKQVGQGDLAAAIAAAEELAAPAKKAMQPWLDKAGARVATDAAVKQLSTQLAGLLAGAQAPRR